MKQLKQFSILAMTSAALLGLLPGLANAGNVGWNVSVGGGYGAWRPAAYGPVYGPAYGPGWGGWRGNWGYGPYGSYGPYGPYGSYGAPYAGPFYAPPVAYVPPPPVAYVSQPMVLAAQPQPPVWYYCEASGKYFPYAQNCPSGWQTQAANPPTGHTPAKVPQH